MRRDEFLARGLSEQLPVPRPHRRAAKSGDERDRVDEVLDVLRDVDIESCFLDSFLQSRQLLELGLRGAFPSTRSERPLFSREARGLSGGIASTPSRRPRRGEQPHAIAATALCDTPQRPRRGPKQLKFEQATTHVIVRWPRVSWTRRDAASAPCCRPRCPRSRARARASLATCQ